MDKNDLQEKIWGFVFGVIAIIAAISEMLVGGISAASVLGAVKDVFGTLVVVVVFVLVIRTLPKTPKNFREVFDKKIESVSEKYGSLIRKEELSVETQNSEAKTAVAKKNKLENVICYEMADNINVLFGTPCSNYKRFLEIENKNNTIVKLLIRKSFFNCPDFTDETLNNIGEKIKAYLIVKFKDYKIEYDRKKNDIIIDTEKTMESHEDADSLAELVDASIMLYIAESKK